MVSDTPETDAHSPASYAIIRPDGVRTDYVPAEFARKLERELREARNTVLRLRRERAAQDKLISILRTSDQTIVEASEAKPNKIEGIVKSVVKTFI